MEIKTKYTPGEEVFFLHENKVTKGVIETVTTESFIKKDEGVTKVINVVLLKYKKEKTEGSGFMSEDRWIEKYLNFKDEEIFLSKEDLIKSL